MNNDLNLVVMLTHNDKTVSSAYKVFDNCKNSKANYFGFKDESTVSRVTTHKYMYTPNGLFELKYFFSSAAGMYNGNTQTSTTSIKHKIKQLIENEGSKILSDDALAECLAAQSIKIARRTIAKYREELGIPSSAQRKRELRKIKI